MYMRLYPAELGLGRLCTLLFLIRRNQSNLFDHLSKVIVPENSVFYLTASRHLTEKSRPNLS